MFNTILIALVLAGQFWTYRALRSRLERTTLGRHGVAAVGLAVVFAVLLIVVWLDNTWMLGPLWDSPRPVSRLLSLGAGVWVVGATAATALVYGLAMIRKLARRLPGPPSSAAGSSRRAFLSQAATAAAVVTPFGAAAYGTLLVRRQFELRDVAFPVRDLPAGLADFRIALLSDIHFGPYLSRPELDRVVAMANETRPHLTLVTGDFITRDGDPLESCLERLALLRAETGVFGCLGNHEIYADCEDLAETRARALGIEILRHRARLLEYGGARLNLAGVDYQRQSLPYLRGAGRLIEPGAVNLLMSHNPDVFPVAAKLGYDLVVGGHTHGGQVTVEILEQTLNVSRFFTPFVAGLYRLGAAAIYVSRGIGTINLPLRLGARPEVTLLRLKRAG